MGPLFVRVLIFCSLLFAGTVNASFQPWSEKVFEYVEHQYGVDAVKRLRYLHNLIIENQNLPVEEKLRLVNTTLNHLPWIADSTHCKKADYWATPMETIATFGGDCEDIAIAKWILLTHMGVSAKHLRLAYVKIKKSGEAHMVLLYFNDPTAAPGKRGPVVLDNYVEEIKPAEQRTDLLAVFTTDANGNVMLINDNGKERSVKAEVTGRKIRKLEELKAKVLANREKYRQLNDGRPLLPEEF